MADGADMVTSAGSAAPGRASAIEATE